MAGDSAEDHGGVLVAAKPYKELKGVYDAVKNKVKVLKGNATRAMKRKEELKKELGEEWLKGVDPQLKEHLFVMAKEALYKDLAGDLEAILGGEVEVDG